MMQTTDVKWTNARGTALVGRCWAHDDEVRAVVCLVHGLGEHCGRYAHVAARLTAAGYAVLACDHHGHGRSEGKRGHAPSYEALMDDIGLLLEQAGQRYPGKPQFLYGHSMGGNFVLNYTLRRRPALAGVVATSPWLVLDPPPPAGRLAVGRMMNRIWPAMDQPNGLDPDGISRDPAVVAAYQADPLNHDRITARLGIGAYDAAAWALEHAAEFPVPLLLVHGTADRLTSPQGTQLFAQRAPDCTLKLWDGLYHETHNEPEQDEVIGFMIEWLSGLTLADREGLLA